MIKSMTGYGRGESEFNGKTFTVEIRSVNHRFCEVVIRMPKYYTALEERVRKHIQGCVSRGRLDVFVNVNDHGRSNKAIQVDKDLAIAYYNALEELRETIGISGKPGIIDIARLPDVILLEETQEDLDQLWPVLEQAVSEAVGHVVEMRTAEGIRLKEDILKRLDRLVEYTEAVSERAPLVTAEYRDKLAARLKELDSGIEIDENRLAAELAFFADKSNISEELVRLRSHFQELRSTFPLEEAVGRKLDFLVQELNREYNTIGSKSNDVNISSMVIKAKSEVEKIREQVQNIE
ncbi:MAG: YicC family protein [Firmicutes bacterium HGW-Firmicutes-14]|nr:MAG: YicC family protein [Firmicutes bacterium HGW-Firmicutes-14]